MGKHAWMTRRTSRSRYPDAGPSGEPAPSGSRTRWWISRAAAWVATGLVAGMMAMLWITGAFDAPQPEVTKIATVRESPAESNTQSSELDTNGVTGNVGGNGGSSGQTRDNRGDRPKAGIAPAGVQKPATDPVDGGKRSKLVVHVAGAVKDPGIVTLAQGSRVHEAISAAGGPRKKAQLQAINLAATVQDGQQLYVPEQGEAAAPGSASAGGAVSGSVPASSTSSAGAGAAESTPLVNINTADETELSTLPGVGPVLSGRIVDWRNEHGAFGSVAELDAVSGIGEKMMATLSDLITVQHGL